MSIEPKVQSPASKFVESVLVGAVESVARAGAKFVESIAGDARKALQNEAFKVEIIEKGVEAWRKARLGEVDDLPASLRDEARAANGHTTIDEQDSTRSAEK